MLTALFFTLGVAFFSCSEEEVAGEAQVGVKMKATSSLSTISSSGRLANTGYTFLEVFVGVVEMEFETLEEDLEEDENDSDDEEKEDEIEFEGNFIVDLIAGTSSPDFGLANIAPGVYEEIEIEMEPILEGGHTVFVAFEFMLDGAPKRVEYSYNEELEFEVESSTGFQLDGTNLNQVLIGLDLDALFAGVDLSTASADVDGVVRINENSNAQMAATIESNFETILEAGKDDDEDGEFDEDEDEDEDED